LSSSCVAKRPAGLGGAFFLFLDFYWQTLNE